jgi:hypothetical protein
MFLNLLFLLGNIHSKKTGPDAIRKGDFLGVFFARHSNRTNYCYHNINRWVKVGEPNTRKAIV